MAKDRKIDMVILGLLSHEDATGYDIKKKIDGQIRFFWKGSFGSIYPALSEMVKLGQIEKVSEDISGKENKRERIMYRITDKGREALKEWLADRKQSNELKYEMLLKLFFGGAADRETAISTIESFEAEVKEDLETLKFYKSNLERIKDEEDHLYYYLTTLFGIETYEAYLKWCAKAKKELKRG